MYGNGVQCFLFNFVCQVEWMLDGGLGTNLVNMKYMLQSIDHFTLVKLGIQKISYSEHLFELGMRFGSYFLMQILSDNLQFTSPLNFGCRCT
jgi:hypothetical protein